MQKVKSNTKTTIQTCANDRSVERLQSQASKSVLTWAGGGCSVSRTTDASGHRSFQTFFTLLHGAPAAVVSVQDNCNSLKQARRKSTLTTHVFHLSPDLHTDVLMPSPPPSPLLPFAPTLSPPLSCLDLHLPGPQSQPRHSPLSQVPGRPRSCMTMMPMMPVNFPCWLMRYSRWWVSHPHTNISVTHQQCLTFY